MQINTYLLKVIILFTQTAYHLDLQKLVEDFVLELIDPALLRYSTQLFKYQKLCLQMVVCLLLVSWLLILQFVFDLSRPKQSMVLIVSILQEWAHLRNLNHHPLSLLLMDLERSSISLEQFLSSSQYLQQKLCLQMVACLLLVSWLLLLQFVF